MNLKVNNAVAIVKKQNYCTFIDKNNKPSIVQTDFFRVLVDNPEFRRIRYQNFLFKGHTFLTGHLDLFLKAFPEEFKVIDGYEKLSFIDLAEIKLSKNLRDYQTSALLESVKHQRGILWLATNAGKSLMICAICKMFPDRKISVISYGVSLIQQTHKTIEEELNEEVGLVYGVPKTKPENRVNVCSINTLACRKWNMKEEILIIDECHLFGAKSGFDYCKKSLATVRLGFSGTALQNKRNIEDKTLNQFSVRDSKLVGILGDVLYRVENYELIQKQVSAKPTVRLYPVRCRETSNYNDAVEFQLVENTILMFKIQDILFSVKNGDYSLIFVNRLQQGYNLSKLLDCPFAHGSTPLEERNYDNKRTLIANKIFDLGMNLPCDHLFLACGGKGDTDIQNANQILQRVGRGLRRTSETLIIHDFYFYGNKYLEAHSEERFNLWKKEKFDIEIISTKK